MRRRLAIQREVAAHASHIALCAALSQTHEPGACLLINSNE